MSNQSDRINLGKPELQGTCFACGSDGGGEELVEEFLGGHSGKPVEKILLCKRDAEIVNMMVIKKLENLSKTKLEDKK